LIDFHHLHFLIDQKNLVDPNGMILDVRKFDALSSLNVSIDGVKMFAG